MVAGDPNVHRRYLQLRRDEIRSVTKGACPDPSPGKQRRELGGTSPLEELTHHLRQQLLNLMPFATLTVQHLSLFLCHVCNKELICRTYKKQPYKSIRKRQASIEGGTRKEGMSIKRQKKKANKLKKIYSS